jgi:hypothetical protein
MPHPASIEVTELTCASYPPPPFPCDALKGIFTPGSVNATANTVWDAMKDNPELYALSHEACAAFEQSEELSIIRVSLRESTPPPLITYATGTPAAEQRSEHEQVPYSFTCDLRDDEDSGISCNILFKHDDCVLLVWSNLLHELAHGFRRLVFWRSHINGVPSVAPWTRTPEVQEALKDALQVRQLWGCMCLDEAAAACPLGIHSGFVAEHALNGGLVVRLLVEPREPRLLAGDDGAPLLLGPMRYALIETRVRGGGDQWATFTGRQVLATDTDIDIDTVRERPLLTWQAPPHAVRFRNSCCGTDPPGVRSCPRSLEQIAEVMRWGR